MCDLVDDYPDLAYRGLTNDCINFQYNSVFAEAYSFSNANINENNYTEESINWNDDEESIECLKQQRKADSDTFQFRYGIVSVSYEKLKEIRKKYKNDFSYERKPIDGNKYHGNLLLNKEKIGKKDVVAIKNTLAFSSKVECYFDCESGKWEKV